MKWHWLGKFYEKVHRFVLWIHENKAAGPFCSFVQERGDEIEGTEKIGIVISTIDRQTWGMKKISCGYTDNFLCAPHPSLEKTARLRVLHFFSCLLKHRVHRRVQ
ncbi:hypothetical protein DWG20_12470 [Crenobacter cavernae]|uniref:Uncharacterized protein n=1 Tax=Crenobacter cavernae TaxID=2290923 RepID=A0A345Y8D8_9NEIS|nr:hypothetical protein DWG20_12470 [Crenobacter cavernae]